MQPRRGLGIKKPMEKLALLEQKRLLQMEVQSLREMAKRVAVGGKKPKQFDSRAKLHHQAKEVPPAASDAAAFVGLLAAE
jgi:hypothetical protein